MKMTNIQILRSHQDDFIKHVGWWAVMNQPDIRIGDTFLFVVRDGNALSSKCRSISPPGESRASSIPKEFADWYIIFYEGLTPYTGAI